MTVITNQPFLLFEYWLMVGRRLWLHDERGVNRVAGSALPLTLSCPLGGVGRETAAGRGVVVGTGHATQGSQGLSMHIEAVALPLTQLE